MGGGGVKGKEGRKDLRGEDVYLCVLENDNRLMHLFLPGFFILVFTQQLSSQQ